MLYTDEVFFLWLNIYYAMDFQSLWFNIYYAMDVNAVKRLQHTQFGFATHNCTRVEMSHFGALEGLEW